MDTNAARDLLHEVEHARAQSSSRLPGFWFPMVLFGALTLASVGVIVGAGSPWLGAYWPVAGISGTVAVSAFYRRRGQQIGFESRPGPYLVAVAVILGGTFLTGMVGGMLGLDMVATVGPLFAVSLGLAMFARIDRHWAVGAFAAATAAVTLGIAVAGLDPDPAALTLALLYGSGSLILGAADWLREQKRP